MVAQHRGQVSASSMYTLQCYACILHRYAFCRYLCLITEG